MNKAELGEKSFHRQPRLRIQIFSIIYRHYIKTLKIHGHINSVYFLLHSVKSKNLFLTYFNKYLTDEQISYTFDSILFDKQLQCYLK